MLWNGHQTASHKWREAKSDLAMEIRSQWHVGPHSGPLAVTLRQYFGDKRKRDVDAYIKIILDAMEGIVYENDNQVVRLVAEKFYDKDRPRVEVELSPDNRLK